jgi:hypothetical protein
MTLLLPKETGGDFERVPAGTFVATCYRIIDLGTQQGEWKGQPKFQHKVMFSWEFPDELMSDGRPFTIHQRYTLSASQKAKLRQDLESWRGVPFTDADFGAFDIGDVLGKSCLMGVVHEPKDGKVYENISSILKLPKGMTPPPLVNEPIYFSLGAFDQILYDKLSDSLKAVIAKSPEYQQLMGAHRIENDVPDEYSYGAVRTDDQEIPF